jgi:hygromycin-B 4-O-kinase
LKDKEPMSDLKPRIDSARVASLLEERFGAPPRNLEVLHGGLISSAFAFTMRDRQYVIRVSADSFRPQFEKELYVSRHYASDRVKIPPVIQVGPVDQWCFAISERIAGVTVNSLSPGEFLLVIPSLVETLEAIHAVDVRKGQGFGSFDGAGVGGSPSWRTNLLSVREEHEPGTFYGAWHLLFATTFLERDVFDEVYDRMVELLDYCPEDRYLVHGDYGFGNVLVECERVTAVLDWSNAMYGDFVFDLAWLDFELPDQNFDDVFRRRFSDQSRIVPNFAERMLCYGCWIALDNMRFNAKTDDEPAYRRSVERIRGQV